MHEVTDDITRTTPLPQSPGTGPLCHERGDRLQHPPVPVADAGSAGLTTMSEIALTTAMLVGVVMVPVLAAPRIISGVRFLLDAVGWR